MALFASAQTCTLREVVLRDKPAEMLTASPKETVPVLVTSSDDVVDESLDIMLWALDKNDPQNWLKDSKTSLALISQSDGPFKHNLDRYKYGNRYKDQDSKNHRKQGEVFLRELDTTLSNTDFLLGPEIRLADIAIFPFIRQFANTDRQWFDQLELPSLHRWLAFHLESDLFANVMKKYPQWKTGDAGVQFVV